VAPRAPAPSRMHAPSEGLAPVEFPAERRARVAMRLRSPIGRMVAVASLAATVAVCARSAAAPDLQLSVLYSNKSSHVGTGQPGTAIITWLTPETATQPELLPTPCPSSGNCQFTVYPSEHACVHFTVPSGRFAAEFTETLARRGRGILCSGQPEHYVAL
jgi:hypothetical protein